MVAIIWKIQIFVFGMFWNLKTLFIEIDDYNVILVLGKEMQRGKMVVWGGLTNSCERREVKSKGEKERHSHLNAEFQRIARRDKQAFLSNQCKEIGENNRMGKTRDKKIRDSKGMFHAKMGSIRDRNGMDLAEAEDIKKRWARIHRTI